MLHRMVARRLLLIAAFGALLFAVVFGPPGSARADVAIRYAGGASAAPGSGASLNQPGSYTVTWFGVSRQRRHVAAGQRASVRMRSGLYTFQVSLDDVGRSKTVWLWPTTRQDINIECSIK